MFYGAGVKCVCGHTHLAPLSAGIKGYVPMPAGKDITLVS